MLNSLSRASGAIGYDGPSGRHSFNRSDSKILHLRMNKSNTAAIKFWKLLVVNSSQKFNVSFRDFFQIFKLGAVSKYF